MGSNGGLALKALRRKTSAVAASCVAVIAIVAGCDSANQYMPPPPPKVTVSVPIRRSFTDYLEYTGTTKAVETVDLRARVKGFLKQRNFEEGKVVKAGQLLLVIDEEPFKVAVDMSAARLAEAEAAVKKAEQSKAKEVSAAQLSLDEAVLLLARLEERRNKNLLDRNAGTRESLDQSEANRRKGEAQVEADKASLEQAKADYQTNILSAEANVAAARADLKNAEINLGYCRISAPFDGRISRRMYDVGNLVGDGQATVLATILKDDPIYSYVNVSESDLLRFQKLVREGRHKDFDKGDVIGLDMGLDNEDGFPHHGVLDYSNPSVDTSSGTVLARGVFSNADRVILPGLFVRIQVALEEKANALLLPERAISRDLVGPFAMIVVDQKDKDGKSSPVVERRDLTLGALVRAVTFGDLNQTIGDFREVTKGLKPDELVIIDNLQRCRPGSPVEPTRADVSPAKKSNATALNTPPTGSQAQ